MSPQNYHRHLVGENGWIKVSQQELKKAKADSDYFDGTQAKRIAKEKRYDEDEKIQNIAARLAVYQEERLDIERQMRETKAEEKEEKSKKQENTNLSIGDVNPSRWLLAGKMGLLPDGSQRLRLMDGRKVIRDSKDRDIFEDTGQLISDYHDEVIKKRLEYQAKKRCGKQGLHEETLFRGTDINFNQQGSILLRGLTAYPF